LNLSFPIIVFSNHGGRQIDTAPPAIECLEDIIKVVDGRAEGTFILIIIFDMI
jgi:isopentenyl diphosphate isomerase/L-lactate dehydrogenase-like FMN-dependent dehydrogenase